MELILKNLSVLLVFATMAAFTWIHGGARADSLLPTIPWLWAFLFEALLLFPQRHPHEDPLVARRRVGNATFWVKFARDGDRAYTVHRAWSHRMRVEKREG